jgi:hypothetical protein
LIAQADPTVGLRHEQLIQRRLESAVGVRSVIDPQLPSQETLELSA